jgi:hypothetical protein
MGELCVSISCLSACLQPFVDYLWKYLPLQPFDMALAYDRPNAALRALIRKRSLKLASPSAAVCDRLPWAEGGSTADLPGRRAAGGHKPTYVTVELLPQTGRSEEPCGSTFSRARAFPGRETMMELTGCGIASQLNSTPTHHVRPTL